MLTLSPLGLFSIAGAHAKYYRLSSQPSVTAVITKKPVTISLTVSKEYDGTPFFSNRDIDVDDFNNAIINGVIDKDFYGVGIDKRGVTGMLPGAEAGTTGTLAISGSFALEGGSAKNYYLQEQPTITAKITKRGVTITGRITATKEYDGTPYFSSEHIDISNAKITGTVDDNDDLIIDKSEVTGTYISGYLKLSGYFKLAGADTVNYFLSKQPDVLAEIIWNIKSYTVSFAGDEININPQTIEHNGKVKKPTEPVRTNYVFGGWFTDNGTFENEWDFESKTVTQDITLYARWTVMTGAVETWHATSDIKIYPNPVKDELFIINNEQFIIKNVQIFDLSGRVVFFPSFGGVGGGFNVSSLSQGVYFVRIETEKGIVTEKFVKE